MKSYLQIISLAALFSFLTLSIIPDNFEEAFAIRGEGIGIKKYGIQTQDLVCGDILCKEVEGQRTMRHVSQTVALKFVDGKTVLSGIEGIGEQEQPTIVLRTGFLMFLNVINQDNYAHMLYVEGLGLQTKDIWPGESDTLLIFSENEGEFNLVDLANNEKVGKLRVVRGDPSIEIPSLPVPETQEFSIPDITMTPTFPVPKPPEVPFPWFPQIRVPFIPEFGLPEFPEETFSGIQKFTIPAMRVAAPGVLQASVAFEIVDGQLRVVGIEGTSETNPTLVTRTGFLYTLTIKNNDTEPHSFFVHGTGMHSGTLNQGESTVLVILPTEEGEFIYYDGITGQAFGKLKIVQVEPKLP